jgi:L-seryl-tRNA(Ser) seleniumtransferase
LKARPENLKLDGMIVSDRAALLRHIPSLDELLRQSHCVALVERNGHAAVADAARAVLTRLREEITAGHLNEKELQLALEGIPIAIEKKLRSALSPSLRSVVNATGVVLHTNLGRAPLAATALERVRELGGGYSNLELDLAAGRRGKRDSHADNLFAVLFEQQLGEAAQKLTTIVVNNNAAAVLLALNSLAEGGEAIVSRGELVEIGGSFRIPEVMAKAGASLREVGTTNRTRLSDYEAAINDRTRVLLRVHRSNFHMVGFTEQPALRDMVRLGHKYKIPVIEDLGSGALVDLRQLGIAGEPDVAASLRSRVDVVTYSGDKLLGGPQAGIITGKKELIQKIRKNPLFRALRVDKLTYAALEATLGAYIRQDFDSIPALRMMRQSAEEIRARAENVISNLQENKSLKSEIIAGESVIGGGAAPAARLQTFLIAVSADGVSAEELARALRQSQPLPIVARVEEGRVLLDLRTVFPAQDSYIAARLRSLARNER